MMVVAPQKDGSPRRTVELKELNAASMGETHHTPSPSDLNLSASDNVNSSGIIELVPQFTAVHRHTRRHYIFHLIGTVQVFFSLQLFHESGNGYTCRYDDITVDMV